MADLNVALILRLVDRATGPARAAMRAIERIGGDGLVRQAQRAQAASAMIAGGVGSIAGAAGRGGLAVAAYGAGIGALAASFVRPAAPFEQFNVQLTTLEGSAAKAESAMAWIETFATKTPLSVEQTVQAYAKLKAFGLDPTTGSLQAMVDTMAATGGGAEKLDGLTLALGQAWSKGKLQGEEAMQMLERGVPVWDLLSKQMGMTTAEVQKLSEQGKLGREEITLLMDALGSKYSGASERASQTWDGIISNLFDQWTRFQRMVMGSGLFVWMKGQLQQLLDTLNTMAANGELQAWAEATGAHILGALQAIRDFGAGVYGVFERIYPVLDRLQEAIGGWDVLAWSALALMFSGTLFRVAAAVKAIGAGLLLLSASPLFLVAAALVLAAYLIYANWDGLVAYFSEKIERIKQAFEKDWISGVFQVLAELNPFGFIFQKLEELYTYLTGMTFEESDLALMRMFDGIDLLATGARIMQSLWDGMKSIMNDLVAWATAKLESITPSWLLSPLPEGAGEYQGPRASNSLPTGPAAPDTTIAGEGRRRALGGPARAGMIYQWQEEGRELFVPNVDGRVISNRQLRSMRGGGGGRAAPSFTIGAINITAAAGQSARDVALAVRRELEDMARAAPLHDGGGYAA